MLRTTQISRTSSSEQLNQSSSSRIVDETSEHTLQVNNMSSPSTTKKRSDTSTQTMQNVPLISSKSVPSFADTQVLSVYYPTQAQIQPSSSDKCISFEQQDRQPVHYRLSYDPLSLTKSTQTSPPSTPLTTHSSTLIINGGDKRNLNYAQRVKIHSGTQNISDEILNQTSLPNELVEESNYSYEEYIVNIGETQNREVSSRSSSASSVTTVIAQNNQQALNKTDSSMNQSSTRISSWPPAPTDETLIQYEDDEQKRLSSERSTRVIPIITTTSVTDKSDSEATNEKTIVIENNSRKSRVNELRAAFEQKNLSSSDSSTYTSPINQRKRIVHDENVAKYGDEIRFHTSSIHHAEPAQIIQDRTNSTVITTVDDQVNVPVTLEQIREITGKSLKSIRDAGYYLQVKKALEILIRNYKKKSIDSKQETSTGCKFKSCGFFSLRIKIQSSVFLDTSQTKSV